MARKIKESFAERGKFSKQIDDDDARRSALWPSSGAAQSPGVLTVPRFSLSPKPLDSTSQEKLHPRLCSPPLFSRNRRNARLVEDGSVVHARRLREQDRCFRSFSRSIREDCCCFAQQQTRRRGAGASQLRSPGGRNETRSFGTASQRTAGEETEVDGRRKQTSGDRLSFGCRRPGDSSSPSSWSFAPLFSTSSSPFFLFSEPPGAHDRGRRSHEHATIQKRPNNNLSHSNSPPSPGLSSAAPPPRSSPPPSSRPPLRAPPPSRPLPCSSRRPRPCSRPGTRSRTRAPC